MKFSTFGKLAGVVLLTASLTACIDATVDINVTSETEATATMTQVMGADFYAMVKANQTAGEAPGSDDFCFEGKLTEGSDGGATCVMTETGPFDDLELNGDDGEGMVFTSAGPGLVRVAMPTSEMKSQLGADETVDAETKAMIESFFTGHSITIRVGGREVIETNMTLSGDRKSAETVLPFIDLLNGEVDLPDELYAVIKVN